MRNCPDLSAVLADLYDKPLLGPKPNQLLVFKRPQLAVKLESLMQATSSAAAKHMNTSLVNQAIAAMYQHPQLHDHVVGWAPVRSGQLKAEVHLSFKDTSAQHRQQLASAGTIQVTMPGAAPTSLPVSTVAAKQLPEVTVVRLHNVPGGINVHGLMASLLRHFQFGPEYSVVSEYGGEVSGDIAAVTPTWCRSDVCIAELRAPVQDAKLRQLPATFTCFGQQVSVSVQPSLLAKAHLYQHRAQPQPQPAPSQSPRQRRRQQQKARANKAAEQLPGQQQPLRTTFCPAVSVDGDLSPQARVALTRPLDPVLDLGGQHSKAGLGHSVPVPMQVEPAAREVLAVIAPPHTHAPASASASAPASAPTTAPAPASVSAPQLEDANMPQALPASVSSGFPDGPVASAMLLWAEDVDVPLDTARQAVQHVHAQHMSLVTQHGTASHVALPEPLQSLMVEAIRAVTGDASFTPHPGTDQPLSPQPPPLASESAPRRSSRARNPVTPYWTVHSAAPGGAQ